MINYLIALPFILRFHLGRLALILQFILVFNIFPACAAGEKPIERIPATIMLEKSDHGKEITIKKGDVVNVRLQAIAGTGYQWHLDEASLEYFELAGHETLTGDKEGTLVG